MWRDDRIINGRDTLIILDYPERRHNNNRSEYVSSLKGDKGTNKLEAFTTHIDYLRHALVSSMKIFFI